MDSGERFRGSMTFDSEAINTLGPTEHGLYRDSITDFWVMIRSTKIEGSPADDFPSEFRVLDNATPPNPEGDMIIIYTDVSSPSLPNLFAAFLFFNDPTGEMLSGTGLPGVPPNLSSLSLDPTINDWGDQYGLKYPAELRLQFQDPTSGQVSYEYGHVTQVTPVPEPGSLLLMAVGGLSLFRRSRFMLWRRS